jgi:hypothetical protein
MMEKSDEVTKKEVDLVTLSNPIVVAEVKNEESDDPAPIAEANEGELRLGKEPVSRAELKLDEPSDSQSSSAAVQAKVQRVGDILTIGKIEVNLSQVLGYGSSGTVVFEGKFQDRRVAVKRIMNYFYHIAQREMEILLHSDDHPSIIRSISSSSSSSLLLLFFVLILFRSDSIDISRRSRTTNSFTWRSQCARRLWTSLLSRSHFLQSALET